MCITSLSAEVRIMHLNFVLRHLGQQRFTTKSQLAIVVFCHNSLNAGYFGLQVLISRDKDGPTTKLCVFLIVFGAGQSRRVLHDCPKSVLICRCHRHFFWHSCWLHSCTSLTET